MAAISLVVLTRLSILVIFGVSVLVFSIIHLVPGDAVTVAGRHVAINGEEVGVAKLQAYDRSPLVPITPTVIPPGHYYVQGTSPDSFDSRYQDSGLVRAEQVVGVVVPLY